MFEDSNSTVVDSLVLSQSSEVRKPILVLLHGFTENHRLWDEVIPLLDEFATVICPDLPGHGGVDFPDSIHSIEGVADWLLDFLKSIQVEKCYLAGHSLGGYVALAAARKYPGYFHAICLIHSTPLEDGPEKKENRDRVIEFIRTHGGQGFIQSLIPALFTGDFLSQYPEKVKSSLARAKETPDHTLLRFLGMMRDRPSSQAWMASGQLPVFAILGAQDTLIPCEFTASLIKSCPDAQVEVLNNSAHMGMLEEPGKVGKALSLFLTSKL